MLRQSLDIKRSEAQAAEFQAVLLRRESVAEGETNTETKTEKALLLGSEGFDYEECSKRFFAVDTPAMIRDLLIEAKKAKELKRQKNNKGDRPVKKGASDMIKSLEDELLELSDRAMDNADGQGETIVFNPDEIADPFGDLLKGLEEEDSAAEPGSRVPRRKNT